VLAGSLLLCFTRQTGLGLEKKRVGKKIPSCHTHVRRHCHWRRKKSREDTHRAFWGDCVGFQVTPPKTNNKTTNHEIILPLLLY